MVVVDRRQSKLGWSFRAKEVGGLPVFPSDLTRKSRTPYCVYRSLEPQDEPRLRAIWPTTTAGQFEVSCMSGLDPKADDAFVILVVTFAIRTSKLLPR